MSITGRGLGDFIAVTIGTNDCQVVNSTSVWIECIVPMSATTGASLISLTTESSVITAGNFDYSDVGAVVIQSVLPEQVHGVGEWSLFLSLPCLSYYLSSHFFSLSTGLNTHRISFRWW